MALRMAKKSFNLNDNPAVRFISSVDEYSPEYNADEGLPKKPKQVETKSKRIQLLLRPSLYKKLKEGAYSSNLSVNEYINQLLEREI